MFGRAHRDPIVAHPGIAGNAASVLGAMTAATAARQWRDITAPIVAAKCLAIESAENSVNPDRNGNGSPQARRSTHPRCLPLRLMEVDRISV